MKNTKSGKRLSKLHRTIGDRSIPVLFVISLLCSSLILAEDTSAVTAGVIAGNDYYLMNVSTGNVILRNTYSGQPLQTGSRDNAAASQRTWHITHKSGSTQYYYFKTPDEYLSSGQTTMYMGYLSGNVVSCSSSATSATRFWWVERSASNTYRGCYLLTISINGTTNYLYETTSGTVAVTSTLSESCYWTLVAVSGISNICSTLYMDFENHCIFNMTTQNDLFEQTMTMPGRTPNLYEGASAITVGACLQTGSVFVFTGHGNAGLIACQNVDGVTLGFVATSVNAVAARESVENPEDYSNFYIRSLSANALGREQCVLYLGCKTAETINGENLIIDTYNKGAHFVFGFTEEQVAADALILLRSFLQGLRGYRIVVNGVQYVGERNLYFNILSGIYDSEIPFSE